MIVPFFLLFLSFTCISQGSNFQRITTCPCDGTLAQAWYYPPIGELGLTYWQGDPTSNTCMVVVAKDGCAWANSSCLELGPCSSPLTATWNITAGITPGSVVFQLTPGVPNVPANSFPLCMDFNADNNFVEVYAVRFQLPRLATLFLFFTYLFSERLFPYTTSFSTFSVMKMVGAKIASKSG